MRRRQIFRDLAKLWRTFMQANKYLLSQRILIIKINRFYCRFALRLLRRRTGDSRHDASRHQALEKIIDAEGKSCRRWVWIRRHCF